MADESASRDATDADGADASATPVSSAESSPADATSASDSDPSRTVEVPDDVYKRVTVFATLFAVVTVVGGFIILDTATNRATAPISEINPVLALLGLGLIVLGAVSYAFSTRFKAEGMGNAKDDTDEPSDNG